MSETSAFESGIYRTREADDGNGLGSQVVGFRPGRVSGSWILLVDSTFPHPDSDRRGQGSIKSSISYTRHNIATCTGDRFPATSMTDSNLPRSSQGPNDWLLPARNYQWRLPPGRMARLLQTVGGEIEFAQTRASSHRLSTKLLGASRLGITGRVAR